MRDLLTFVLVTLWCPSNKLLWHVKDVPNIMSKSKMYLLMTNMTLKNIKSKTNSLTYCDQRTAKLRLSTYHRTQFEGNVFGQVVVSTSIGLVVMIDSESS